MNTNTTTTTTLAKPGDTVRVRLWGGGTKIAIVEAAYQNIKGGRPGYDLADGTWCYLDQTR